MKRYLFYPAADASQDAIWHYTNEQWGEAQAEHYINELHAHLKLLANEHFPWQALPRHMLSFGGPQKQVYVSRHKKHFIFFHRFEDGDIGVMSILHEAMDIPVRLREDLRKFENKE